MTLTTLPAFGFTWLVLELCCTRRSGANEISKDRGSLRIIGLSNAFSIFFSVAAARHLPDFSLPARNFFYIAGIGIFLTGLVLRFYSIFYLGRFFTVNVAIAADHRLIDSGPYRFIRHPSYTGLLMLFLGLGLGMGNWLSVAILILPIFAALLWRMKIEEAALSEALGEPYRDYLKRTKRLIPLIY